MTELRARDLTTAAQLAALVSGLVALTALVVHLAAAQDARHWLGFTFPGLPREFDAARDIFLTNVRLLGSVLGACLVVQLVRGVRPANRVERAAQLGTVGMCDLVLISGCALHVLFVGSALGAYGDRTLGALLPHGPVELAAFSLGLALYLAARRERLAPGRFLSVGLACVAGLAIAALLEVLA